VKWSQFFIQTLREAPSDAEVVSHQLMVRAGFIRKVAAGIYNYLPLGLRVLRKIEDIIREEMNAAGATEVLLPIIMPRELWDQSGRWKVYGKELLRLKDRHERDYCVGPTHEEAITSLVAGELRSYRQLPLNLYQIQTKFRDEIRPRFGLMRGREFIMKDAYSFDVSEEKAMETYRQMEKAYRRIFDRCGLQYRSVEALSGAIGGNVSHEFQVLASSGEDEILSCDHCDYAANADKAQVRSEAQGQKTSELLVCEKVTTPQKTSVEEVAQFLNLKPYHLVKTLIYVLEQDQSAVAVLIRGDHEVSEGKLQSLLNGATMQLADEKTVQKVTGGPCGYSGPIGLKGISLYADESVRSMKNFVVGANEAEVHWVNANLDRDFKVERFADLRRVQKGDSCPRCEKGRYQSHRGIEVGQVFYLGTKYSTPMGVRFLDENGKEKTAFMGCYGIGVGRTAAAAIEQNHDEHGIIWPLPMAPFSVEILSLHKGEDEVLREAQKIYEKLTEKGIDVLIDDRNESPGVKFKDADLIGIPWVIIIGAKSLARQEVEIKERRTGQKQTLSVKMVVDKIVEVLNA